MDVRYEFKSWTLFVGVGRVVVVGVREIVVGGIVVIADVAVVGLEVMRL